MRRAIEGREKRFSVDIEIRAEIPHWRGELAECSAAAVEQCLVGRSTRSFKVSTPIDPSVRLVFGCE